MHTAVFIFFANDPTIISVKILSDIERKEESRSISFNFSNMFSLSIVYYSLSFEHAIVTHLYIYPIVSFCHFIFKSKNCVLSSNKIKKIPLILRLFYFLFNLEHFGKNRGSHIERF